MPDEENLNTQVAETQETSQEQSHESSPTDEGKIALGDYETTLDDLRKNEALKDVFDAYDNKSKWQKSYTQRDQELADFKRKGELYDRLVADPRFTQAFSQPQTQQQADDLAELRSRWGNQFNEQFVKDLLSVVEKRVTPKIDERISPFTKMYSEGVEKQFLNEHPLVQVGTPKYYQLADAVQQKGIPLEVAYKEIYHEDILRDAEDRAVKKYRADAEAKLKQMRGDGVPGGWKPKSKDASGRAMEIIDRMY